jgi:dipeptidyl aminopeptidase/acylaminoacyl peptidase
MASLRDLLEARWAFPAGVSDVGSTLLVSSNLTGTMQLFRAPARGGDLEQLTDLAEPVAGTLVPRSEQVVVQVDSGGNELQQLYLLDRELRPLVVDERRFHRWPRCSPDGRLLGYVSNRRNGVDHDVYLRELATGEERLVFAPGGWTELHGFSPDGRWLAVSRETEVSGDNELHLVDVATGESFEALEHEDASFVGPPAWLEGGGGFHVAADVGRDLAAIARVELATRAWEYVVEDEWELRCHGDRGGRHVLIESNEDGFTRLRLHGGREIPLPGRGVAGAFEFSGDGRLLAYHFTSPLVPGDVWVFDTATGEAWRATQSPAAVDPGELTEPELHRVESFDGESVPLYLYLPRGGGPFPAIVLIHGGPEAQLRPVWNPVLQYFVAAGYAVVGPNVRGSTGYGKRYEHLDDVRKRLDSVRDLVAIHDWLARHPRVDASRAVLYGGSYGGYMVLAGLAFFPERWAAGLETVGISSLVTFLENTADWRRAFREREYGSLEHDRDFLHEVSPLTQVDRIRAPLFVIHGANDPRVPLGEAQQIHASLTARGIPCELLVYDDEGHGLQKLKNRLDAYPRMVGFLERVLEPVTPGSRS